MAIRLRLWGCLVALVVGCSDDGASGTASGGSAEGGQSTGGQAVGGGGQTAGGQTVGGQSTGGADVSSGGQTTGGQATGGSGPTPEGMCAPGDAFTNFVVGDPSDVWSESEVAKVSQDGGVVSLELQPDEFYTALSHDLVPLENCATSIEIVSHAPGTRSLFALRSGGNEASIYIYDDYATGALDFDSVGVPCTANFLPAYVRFEIGATTLTYLAHDGTSWQTMCAVELPPWVSGAKVGVGLASEATDSGVLQIDNFNLDP